jgi:hypothetical protein
MLEQILRIGLAFTLFQLLENTKGRIFYCERCCCILTTFLYIHNKELIKNNNNVKCRVVRVTKTTGSSSDDWIYYHFGYKLP